MPHTGYLLSDDMMFTSRITGTARDLGLEIKVARSQAGLDSMIESQPPAAVIIDLASPGLRLPRLLTVVKASNPAATIVAYGSHVDSETLRAARHAGCDVVLPRSQFAERLPQLLPEWLSSTESR